MSPLRQDPRLAESPHPARLQQAPLPEASHSTCLLGSRMGPPSASPSPSWPCPLQDFRELQKSRSRGAEAGNGLQRDRRGGRLMGASAGACILQMLVSAPGVPSRPGAAVPAGRPCAAASRRAPLRPPVGDAGTHGEQRQGCGACPASREPRTRFPVWSSRQGCVCELLN